MRIAVWHNLGSGGAKRALYDHVHGLVERGHHVEAWCPPTADNAFLPLAALIEEHEVPMPGSASPPWWSGRRRDSLRAASKLMKALAIHSAKCAAEMHALGFDVYLAATCQFFGSPPIGRYLRGPSVLFLQEPHRWLYEAHPEFPWLAAKQRETRLRTHAHAVLEAIRIHRRSQRARFEVDNAHAFDRILVNSLFSRESVLRIYGVEPDVCYLGIDTTRFKPTGVDREDIVVGVGALAPHKNAGLLVEAVGLLSEPRPRVVWVGASADEAYGRRVVDEARRRSVPLEVRKSASDAELIDLLSRAKALVYTPRLEPFGLVPLEAAACELPVVGVAEGGLRETIVDGVNGLVTSGRPEALADALSTLLSDNDLGRRMGREARALVERSWTLDAAIDRLEAALTTVSQSPATSPYA